MEVNCEEVDVVISDVGVAIILTYGYTDPHPPASRCVTPEITMATKKQLHNVQVYLFSLPPPPPSPSACCHR